MTQLVVAIFGDRRHWWLMVGIVKAPAAIKAVCRREETEAEAVAEGAKDGGVSNWLGQSWTTTMALKMNRFDSDTN
ncbi:hypothetical protein U1Q18_006253 [Sarracenia purpurea var. burkii]